MRLVQVSIKVERFGEQAPDGKRHHLNIYADANNPYEALCAAFYEALNALQVHCSLPSGGRRMSSGDGCRHSAPYNGDWHYREDMRNTESSEERTANQ